VTKPTAAPFVPHRSVAVAAATLWLLLQCRSFPEPSGRDSHSKGGEVDAGNSGTMAAGGPEESGGMGGSGGGPGRSSSEGSGGDAGAGDDASEDPDDGAGAGVNGGAGGAVEPPPAGENEPAFVPSCAAGFFSYPTSVTSLAVAMTFSLGYVTLAVTDDVGDTGHIRWTVDDTNWTPWICADAVRRPRHIASMNLPNGHPEHFIATADGDLFVRRSYPFADDAAWTSWMPFTRPFVDPVIDVAVADGPIPVVYAVSRGVALARQKVEHDAYSSYGPWQSLGTKSASIIAAVRTDAGHEVFVASEGGGLSLIRRSGHEPGASYADAVEVGAVSPSIVDLAASSTSEGTWLYVLEGDGRITMNRSIEMNAAWTEVRSGNAKPKLVAIAAGATSEGEPLFFGVTTTGDVHQLRDQAWHKLD
jgi:hypothetical protein